MYTVCSLYVGDESNERNSYNEYLLLAKNARQYQLTILLLRARAYIQLL